MRNSYEEDARRWRKKELTNRDFKKAEEALKKANVPPPYKAIVSP